MPKSFEFANHPSQFETQLLRELVTPLPAPDPGLTVETYYLAVFDKDINYPTPEAYRKLLEDQLVVEPMVEAVLKQPPTRQYGFGSGAQDVTVSIYPFVSDAEPSEGHPDLEVLVFIEVETIHSPDIH